MTTPLHDLCVKCRSKSEADRKNTREFGRHCLDCWHMRRSLKDYGINIQIDVYGKIIRSNTGS